MSSMPENFPRTLAFLYPFIYNFSFLGAEAAITVFVLCLPPVRKALEQIRKIVL
jgi:thiamine transporter